MSFPLENVVRSPQRRGVDGSMVSMSFGGWVVGWWVLPGIDGLCLQRSSFFEAWDLM